MTKGIKISSFLTAVALGLSLATYAEDVNETGWRFTPYFWLPLSVDVDSTVDGQTVPIDLGLDDIFDNFEVFALSARAEYWWGEWGAVVDGLWSDLDSKDINPPPVPIKDADVDIAEGILDMLAAYRVAIDSGGSVRLMGGARYHYLKQEITLTRVDDVKRDLGGSKDWMELLFAGQYVQPFARRWLFTARGDIGGFGIGSAPDITLSAMAGVGYEFATHWAAQLGYRYYYIDYSNGSGTDEFGIEGSMHGPWIGIAYQR
jgi:opacity protein-like surface antigen